MEEGKRTRKLEKKKQRDTTYNKKHVRHWENLVEKQKLRELCDQQESKKKEKSLHVRLILTLIPADSCEKR